MTIPVALHLGARHVVVTEPSHYRRELAHRQGATLVRGAGQEKLAAALAELGRPDGFDVGLEMSGNPTALRDLLARMTHGGRVAVLGLPDRAVPTDWADIALRMLTVQGISGRRIFHTWHQMATLLDTGIDPAAVVTHHFDPVDHDKAFAHAAQASAGKTILDWAVTSERVSS
ncbi:zinc-binding dehydrogenase [Actinomadura sp. KC06]|uniref:zinc-binding dehydrogenase n=1 Tax=Actinomadura sp. KC06 TaxID=2530369 RepID=UPI001FB6D889|nr:zinc-binding dehydrogenase [Actinomadura sp. KC06]